MFSLASHCWGHIPESEPLKDALDLFERMIKRNDLSRQNLCTLTELLFTISRIDLVEELETQEFDGWYFLVYVTDVSLSIFRSLPITVLTLLFISSTLFRILASILQHYILLILTPDPSFEVMGYRIGFFSSLITQT